MKPFKRQQPIPPMVAADPLAEAQRLEQQAAEIDGKANEAAARLRQLAAEIRRHADEAARKAVIQRQQEAEAAYYAAIVDYERAVRDAKLVPLASRIRLLAAEASIPLGESWGLWGGPTGTRPMMIGTYAVDPERP